MAACTSHFAATPATNEFTLHDQAKELVPAAMPEYEDHLAIPDAMIIAIERHDKDSEHWQSQDARHRFMWMKGKRQHTVRKLRKAYTAQYQEQNPGLNVTLKLGDWTPPENVRMSGLSGAEEWYITFAANTVNNPSMAQPPNTYQTAPAPFYPNTPGTPDHASLISLGQTTDSRTTPSQTPARQLLQPVNRQIYMPTRELPGKKVKAEPDDTAAMLGDENFSSPHLTRTPSVLPSAHPNQFTQPDNATTAPAMKSEPPSIENSTLQDVAMPDAELPAVQESQDYQPRDQDNPFATSQEDEDIRLPDRGRPLQELTKSETPERLEAGVRAGVKVLEEITAPLMKLTDSADAIKWLKQIEGVRAQAVKHRTVVGVVGNTGAGKSSVINAMLDEERLVPTNCMRACTAVVTEMSYNESNSEAARYRAEIEFIQPDDWRKELKILFEEVFDENGGFVHATSNPDSEAGIAYAKIRAVYHKHTKEMLSRASVKDLMNIKHVLNVLGTTREITARESSQFYRRLQHYVDSKEKGTEKKDKNGSKISNQKREFEFWPLIRVVKIYTKADAFATGAVIVDLPGVHDSNAARAAVAESYMKQCTGLWIVAPINRAVDDKAAKTLLGNTFKRQLKYDGIYSAVTFICSKTDDISRTEATDSLNLGDTMAGLEQRLSELGRERRAIDQQLRLAKGKKEDQASAAEDIDDQIEKWDECESRLEDGETVYPPTPKKRKRSTKISLRKRRRTTVDSDDDDEIEYIESSDDESADDEPEAAPSTDRTPVTQDQISAKVDELKAMKKEARRSRISADNEIRELSKQIKEIKDDESAIDARQSAICIAGRNDYSRTAIQQDFAQGIRELDQETAEDEDPDNFNPEEDHRDYDEVARNLSVFCVSSRAYQQISGRLQKDNKVAGFETAEQTEIPQLQAHCKDLTVKGRQASCRRFLNSVAQLINSLGLWASDNGTGAKTTIQQRDLERSFLKRRLKSLEKALMKAVDGALEDVESTLGEQVFDKFPAAVKAGADLALPTSSGWGAHKTVGGLMWATYKATTRRNGVFAGASGARDFNNDLADPLYKQLASPWEKAFQRRLPHILQTFTRTGTDLLKKFHSAIASRCRERGHGLARIGMLENQLVAYQAILGDLANGMITQINEGQREINREFTPMIGRIMEPAYTLCTDECGPGSFARMKGHMANHVMQQKVTMFEDATKQVKSSIMKLCDTVRGIMLDRADSIYLSMQRDYMSIIGGVNVDIKMPRQECAARREVDDAIGRADGVFGRVVEAGLEELVETAGAKTGEGEEEAFVEMDADDADDSDHNNEEDGDGSGQAMETNDGSVAGASPDL